ncbi:MAG: DUF1080 domain-containing protein [Planctomycetes bacterium]|nr:DUF1080 domain-containing protein [Planctomycetota bacterium]
MSRRVCLAALMAGSLFLGATGRGEDKARPGPIPVLIITGENNHDWKATTPVLKAALEECGRFKVDVLEDLWDGLSASRLAPYQALVFNFYSTSNRRWSEEQATAFLDAFRAQGKGGVVIHAADNAFPDWADYDQLIGGAWRAGAGHGSFHAFQVDLIDRGHPITSGLPRFFLQAPDELYHGLRMQPGVRILAAAFSDRAGTGGTDHYEPMAWTHRYGKARIFHTPLGHAPSSMESAGFKTLLQRGAEWAATGQVTVPSLLPEWQPFFNGKDLSEFKGDAKLWRVEDGAIIGDSPGIRHNAFLVSNRRYDDFILELKVRLRPDSANSGVQFRSEPLENGEMYGYQADIGEGWWGSLYDESTGRNLLVNSYKEKGSKAVKREDWNDYRVEAIGRRVRVFINGALTSEFEDTENRPDGHIALQIHAGGVTQVEFKDIRIQEK